MSLVESSPYTQTSEAPSEIDAKGLAYVPGLLDHDEVSHASSRIVDLYLSDNQANQRWNGQTIAVGAYALKANSPAFMEAEKLLEAVYQKAPNLCETLRSRLAEHVVYLVRFLPAQPSHNPKLWPKIHNDSALLILPDDNGEYYEFEQPKRYEYEIVSRNQTRAGDGIIRKPFSSRGRIGDHLALNTSPTDERLTISFDQHITAYDVSQHTVIDGEVIDTDPDETEWQKMRDDLI